MKRTIKFVSIVTMAVALTQSVQAVSITGAMAFAGQVTYDNSSPGNATQVTSWTSTYVSSDSGTFAAPSPFAVKTGPSSAVTFTHTAWSFNTSSPISDFWSVGGFTFQLLSSFVVSQGGTPGVNGFVVVDGTGIVSGNGYTPTTMSWSFTSQDLGSGTSPKRWTFNSTANSTSGPATVPDSGMTAMLLGIALSGVVLLKKKLSA